VSLSGLGHWLKRQLAAVMPPVIFLALAGYFAWSATQGDRGLNAYALRQQDLLLARAQLSQAETETAMWERRVSALRSNNLDVDALDERVRSMLNLSQPDDIVVPYGQGKRLFP
jgi:cell division protein FtsB